MCSECLGYSRVTISESLLKASAQLWLTVLDWLLKNGHFSLTCCVVQYTVSDSLAVACIEIIENSTFQTSLCFLWYILQFLDLSLGSHLLLTVCLQGIPLAPALQTHIFQPEEAEYVKPSFAVYGNMGLL